MEYTIDFGSIYVKMKDIITENRQDYLKEFEVSPDFKAGFHFGPVTTGEIGSLKKDIIFTKTIWSGLSIHENID